ncbi:MAG: hypothetical protein RIR39_1273 [Pseudomonadota bacterium]|jgi:hypothetical protein
MFKQRKDCILNPMSDYKLQIEALMRNNTMNLAETIYQKSLDLPEEKAIEVIDFIDFIKNRTKINQSIRLVKEHQKKEHSVQHDINRHAGKITLSQDPLEFQKSIREEWT